jgi:neutral trehalase
LWEKYNVDDPLKPVSVGEYPLQSGFGWTIGVLEAVESGVRSLINERKLKHLSLRVAA